MQLTFEGPDLPSIIAKIKHELGLTEVVKLIPKPVPAVSINKSVAADYIICLEDGLKFKSLKRHLRAKYNLTPDQYRERWGLPGDYPMVPPNYAIRRSKLAKEMGLGLRRRSLAATAPGV